MHRLIAVIAASLAVLAVSPTLVPGEVSSAGNRSTTTTAPVVEPQSPSLRHGCGRLYTQRQHSRYARRVYQRDRISDRADTRLRRMRHCQHSIPAERNTRRLEAHLRRDRAERQELERRIARMGNRGIGLQELIKRGWASQFPCLDTLWHRESGWNHRAKNPSSGAYGIPQSLPATKMARFGRDWLTNARTQIRWGLWYIKQRYGTPCNALAFWRAHHWY